MKMKSRIVPGVCAIVLFILAGCNFAGTDGPETQSEPLGMDNGIQLRMEGHVWVLRDAWVEYLGIEGLYSPRRIMTAENVQAEGSYTDAHRLQGRALVSASVTVAVEGPASQTCGTKRNDGGFSVKFEQNGASPSDNVGVEYVADSCVLDVSYRSAFGGFEGKIAYARLRNVNGATLEVRDVEFRVYHYEGLAGAAPAVTSSSAWSATLQIDSGNFELASGRHFLMHPLTPESYYVEDPAGVLSLRLFNPPTLPGDYLCGYNTSTGLLGVQVWLGTPHIEMKLTNAKGSCTLHVSGQEGGALRGDYEGRLYLNGDSTLPSIKVRGGYRN
jgi:hypothetical protein